MSVWRLSALALCLKSSDKHLAKSWSPGASWSRIEGLDPGSRAFAAAPWPSPLPPPGPSLTGAGSRRDPGWFTWSDGSNQYLNQSNFDPTLWILASSATLNPEWLGGAFSLFLQSDIICCSWYSRSRAAARLVICYLLSMIFYLETCEREHGNLLGCTIPAAGHPRDELNRLDWGLSNFIHKTDASFYMFSTFALVNSLQKVSPENSESEIFTWKGSVSACCSFLCAPTSLCAYTCVSLSL